MNAITLVKNIDLVKIYRLTNFAIHAKMDDAMIMELQQLAQSDLTTNNSLGLFHL